jgi:hypothetical protein
MNDRNCRICGVFLAGRQRKYCSRTCKNAETNHRYQSYVAQTRRGVVRKLALIGKSGGRCKACGYCKNLAALTWHHVNPEEKSFELDLRSLSNRSERAIQAEVRKCILLCANCHAEAHFPHLALTNMIAT